MCIRSHVYVCVVFARMDGDLCSLSALLIMICACSNSGYRSLLLVTIMDNVR